MEEHFLGEILAADELNVIDHQHDDGPELLLEVDRVLFAERPDEPVHELFGRKVNDGAFRSVFTDLPGDGMHQMRLAKAEQLEVKMPPKVLEFLAHKITANVRELEGGLNRVVAHSQLVGREITLEATQDVLHDLLRANDRRVTIEEIQKRVAAHFNIRLSDMHSARRARSVARPRQVAMYLAKQLTARSLPEIGRKFGGRDHTTVMHAVKKVDELREQDSSFAEDVELLRRMLEG